MPEIETHLAALRQKRGLSAAQLAKLTGASRQTIYAIEAGSFVPNTALALKLAHTLEATVEEIFALPDDAPARQLRTEHVSVLPGGEKLRAGQPVQLCRVGRRMVASAATPAAWYFPISDAVVSEVQEGEKTDVEVFDAGAEFEKRILVAGCDPAISVLSRHVAAAGVELVLAHRNSSQALELLKEGSVHVAGTHLRDEDTGESNLPEVGRRFGKNSVAVISFAVWEDGIVTARNNPKSIRGVADFGRPDITIVNREPGAGSRRLLDSSLKQSGIAAKDVRGYHHEALGHLPAAWQVLRGAADCCIATRAAARVLGLDFIPLGSERYDLAIRRQHLELPGIQALLDTLSRSAFRRELETLGGYDTRTAGRRMM